MNQANYTWNVHCFEVDSAVTAMEHYGRRWKTNQNQEKVPWGFALVIWKFKEKILASFPVYNLKMRWPTIAIKMKESLIHFNYSCLHTKYPKCFFFLLSLCHVILWQWILKDDKLFLTSQRFLECLQWQIGTSLWLCLQLRRESGGAHFLSIPSLLP